MAKKVKTTTRRTAKKGDSGSREIVAPTKAAAKSPSVRKSKKISSGTVFDFIRLKQIRLVGSQTRLHISGGELPKDSKVAVSATFAVSASLNVLIDTTIEVKAGDTESLTETSYMLITATYQCVFETDSATEKELRSVSDAISNAGVSMAWPYLREFIQSSALRMALPPMAIPAFITKGSAKNALSFSQRELSKDS